MARRLGERERLLAAVCDEPDEDAPGLVFADWLEEHGQPDWAALTRKQLAMHGRPEHAP